MEHAGERSKVRDMAMARHKPQTHVSARACLSVSSEMGPVQKRRKKMQLGLGRSAAGG